MRFDLTRACIKRGLWHRWFAWHPVRVGMGDWRWLEVVDRCGERRLIANGDGQPEWFWDWEYREPTKN